MSQPVVADPRAQVTPTPDGFSRADEGDTLVTRVRRRPLGVIAAVLFVALVVTLVWTSRPADYTPLSTENSTPTGTRALAQILRGQGVDVRQVATMADARVEDPENTTLVIADSGPLADYQLDAVVDYPGDIVLVGPSQAMLDLVAPALTVEPTLDSSPVAARCEDPDATAAERVRVADQGLGGQAGEDGVRCFPNADGTHAYGVIDDGDRRIAIIASAPLVTNELLAQDGNAALALRALGRHESLVWYVGDLLDPSTLTWSDQDGTGGTGGADNEAPPTEIEANPDFLPPGTGSVFYLLALTVLVAAWWRARRFGPLVRESLPVIVRASEATRGRARLYRRSRASGRATAALRARAAGRMARRLGVPRAAGKAALVSAVARAAHRDESDVERIIYGDAPTNDSTMMSIIQELDTLESEVHRP